MKHTYKNLGLLLALILLVGIASASTTVDFKNAGGNSDGRVALSEANTTFTLLRNGLGNTYQNTTGAISILGISSNTTSPNYNTMIRYVWCGDTSSIPDGSAATAATFSMYGWGTRSMGLGNFTVVMTGANPGNPALINASDYNTFESVPLSDNITWQNWSITGWNNFTLNAAGLSEISKTGTTCIMLRSDKDVDNTTTGISYYAGQSSVVRGYDTTGTPSAYDPLMTVTYSDTAPTAAFSADVTSGTSPLSVTFTDASTNATTWNWYFWDNETLSSALQNPVQAFTSGSYSIRLNASSTGGYDWENKTGYIGVGGSYTNATFYDMYDGRMYEDSDSQFIPMRNAAGDYVSTGNTIFSDLSTSNITNTFASNYRGAATWDTSTLGSTATITAATITAYVSPSLFDLGSPTYAWIDFNPASKTAYVGGDYGATTFTRMTNSLAATSFATHDVPITWTLTTEGINNISKTGLTSFMFESSWMIDNSSPTWSSLKETSASIYGYRYSSGLYAPRLNVTYSTTAGGPPSADFTTNTTSCGAPCAVQFTDISSNNPTSWAWAWSDDGALFNNFDTPTSQNPVQTFDVAGNYSIYFTAYNALGSGNIYKYGLIYVGEPEAKFNADPSIGSPPLTVQFYDNSTNAPTSWLWDFGDGSTSTSQNPSHVFSGVGDYTVRLKASNATAYSWVNKTEYILVGWAPTAHFCQVLTGGVCP